MEGLSAVNLFAVARSESLPNLVSMVFSRLVYGKVYSVTNGTGIFVLSIQRALASCFCRRVFCRVVTRL